MKTEQCKAVKSFGACVLAGRVARVPDKGLRITPVKQMSFRIWNSCNMMHKTGDEKLKYQDGV